MSIQVLEKVTLGFSRLAGNEGPLALPDGLWKSFTSAPYDICPDFKGPEGYKWKDARGKDHPRYGRFVYALAKYFRPERIVEVGTDTGGTAVGWARALVENGHGQLICVDNDAYAQSTYPRAVQDNLRAMGIPATAFDLRKGDSKLVVPHLAKEFPKQVDIYLVDGDHTYEGARADLYNGLPMVKSGGFILVHDIDRGRPMNEATSVHPQPVYEAFMEMANQFKFKWCILGFIRKHLGILQIN
jgi:predicted O-methyltransferase YrrM